jgi:hypothetical protein
VERVTNMRRLLGHLAFCAGLGVLIAATGTPVARGATIYEITVTINNLTTATSTSFKVDEGDPNDTNLNPNAISADGAFLDASSAASGLTFVTLGANTASASSATGLAANSTFSLNPGVTDHYLVTILTTHDTYTLPASTSAALNQSESGTYAFTGAGNTQVSQSWYSPTNTANSTLPPGTPVAVISIPASSGTTQGGAGPFSTAISPYVIPYALTNRIMVDILGTGGNPNSIIQVQSLTSLASVLVPEPASLVMFLTGIPLPIVLVRLLRRRRRVAA